MMYLLLIMENFNKAKVENITFLLFCFHSNHWLDFFLLKT